MPGGNSQDACSTFARKPVPAIRFQRQPVRRAGAAWPLMRPSRSAGGRSTSAQTIRICITSLERQWPRLISSRKRILCLAERDRSCPGSRTASCGLGEAFARQGQWDAASAFRSGIDVQPENASLRAQLGELLLRAGRLESAIAALTEATESDPRVVRFLYMLSIVLERAQRFKEAADAVRRVRELEPANPAWSLRLAQLLLRAGALDDAELAFKQTLELNPDSAEARDGLAAIAASRSAATAPVPQALAKNTESADAPAPDSAPAGQTAGGRLRRLWRRQQRNPRGQPGS